ncbi:class I SAM-dependent methyltransferase [Myroides phaeus]|uniref:Methyltransferase domain-containing protein n=1 Tax=Myroides phaeus TaxID=702745 RepID=A0A1G8FJW7_9FLAO|nr:class I SAM-dependent methyltransferase [Myroides phaeus]SDH82408.1 Methyltransferase domain-containing protein [Myroides phaeus]
MSNFWDNRYKEEVYAYGTTPNRFFEQALSELPQVGTVLLAAEGEGRNAVFAAQQGWTVSAFDMSVEGQKKAMKLAQDKGVVINYLVSTVKEIDLDRREFDTLGLIFAHFPEEYRRIYHRKLAKAIKKGGTLILEGFSKQHKAKQEKNPAVGGPGEVSMLFDLAELKEDFQDFTFTLAEEQVVTLQEGQFHLGEAAVIRLIGVKQ